MGKISLCKKKMQNARAKKFFLSKQNIINVSKQLILLKETKKKFYLFAYLKVLSLF